MKPRLFIGSSTEGLEVARQVELHLASDCEPILWKSQVFPPNQTFIESLEKVLHDVEFAVLVVTPDDLREKRKSASKVPRDNVVFELGLFMGRLGRPRTFVVCDPRKLSLPTDLKGVQTAEYDSERSDGNLAAAVSTAATQILNGVKRAPRLHRSRRTSASEQFLVDEEALLNRVAGWPAANCRVTVQMPDTRWVWRIFPTLLHWRLSEVPVQVFSRPLRGGRRQDRRQETARRHLLSEIGAKFREVADLSPIGFFLKTPYPEDDEAIVINEGDTKVAPLAIRYVGAVHEHAVAALASELQGPAESDTKVSYVPRLVPHDVGDVFERLRRGVRQYGAASVRMEATKLATTDLWLMTPFARAYKYRQIERLRDSYFAAESTPFQALAVELASGAKSIVTPPVVEERREGPVVLEGTTRAAFCYRNKIADYHCIRVTGVREALPGQPVRIPEVTLAERMLLSTERTEDFDWSLFRSIERAVHPY